MEGWPSIPFLLADRGVTVYDPATGLALRDGPAAVYAWPYDSLDFLRAVAPPALVAVEPGPLARGDLEPRPYSLYTRYTVTPGEGPAATAEFDQAFRLSAAAAPAAADAVAVDLAWAVVGEGAPDAPLPQVFVHVLGPEGMLAQYDGPIAFGQWPAPLWRPLLRIGERHTLALMRAYDPASDRIEIGLYWPDSGARLPLRAAGGRPSGDALVIAPEP